VRVSPNPRLLARIDHGGTRAVLFPNDVALGPDRMLYMADSGVPPKKMSIPPSMIVCAQAL